MSARRSRSANPGRGESGWSVCLLVETNRGLGRPACRPGPFSSSSATKVCASLAERREESKALPETFKELRVRRCPVPFFKITDCDLETRLEYQVPAIRLHRARRHHGGNRSQKSARRPVERLRRSGVCADAPRPRWHARTRPQTGGTGTATRWARRKHPRTTGGRPTAHAPTGEGTAVHRIQSGGTPARIPETPARQGTVRRDEIGMVSPEFRRRPGRRRATVSRSCASSVQGREESRTQSGDSKQLHVRRCPVPVSRQRQPNVAAPKRRRMERSGDERVPRGLGTHRPFAIMRVARGRCALGGSGENCDQTRAPPDKCRTSRPSPLIYVLYKGLRPRPGRRSRIHAEGSTGFCAR